TERARIRACRSPRTLPVPSQSRPLLVACGSRAYRLLSAKRSYTLVKAFTRSARAAPTHAVTAVHVRGFRPSLVAVGRRARSRKDAWAAAFDARSCARRHIV